MGELVNSSLLDLSSIKTVEELGTSTIVNSGTLVIPERLMPQLDIVNSGTLIPVPEGVRVERWKGDMYVSGEDLAVGDASAILFIPGALYITSPVESVGYRELRIVHTTFIPLGSEGVIRPKLSHLSGPTFSYRYPDGARVLNSNETIGKAFLEMLPGPTPLVVCRELTLADDVTPEILRQRVPEIVLLGGSINAASDLLATVQFLAVQRLGDGHIKASAAGTIREIYGSDTLTKDYLEFVPCPVEIRVFGMLSVESDVTLELLDRKVAKIETFGTIKAPKRLIPLIQTKGNTFGQVVGY